MMTMNNDDHRTHQAEKMADDESSHGRHGNTSPTSTNATGLLDEADSAVSPMDTDQLVPRAEAPPTQAAAPIGKG